MISVFSKAKQWNSRSPKLHTSIVIALILVFILLYMAALVLYLLLAFYKDEAVRRICLLTNAVIEIVITVLSILISLTATRISDHYTNECIECIKYINKQNTALFNDHEWLSQEQNLSKKNKFAFRMRYVILVPFLLYMSCMLIYLIGVKSTPIQILTATTGALSSICSIILALVSTLFCAITGQNTNYLLSKLANDNIKLADLYNNLLIKCSFSENL